MIELKRVYWSGHAACMVEMRNDHRIGKPERKRSLGRPNYRWEADIKMDLREIRLDSFGS
jgi:hypothetical protein